jgi:hypothetical protein
MAKWLCTYKIVKEVEVEADTLREADEKGMELIATMAGDWEVDITKI